MPDRHTLELAQDTFRKLAPELAAVRTQGLAARPSLERILAEAAPLPPGALFLGLAADGLPVMLDLHDPASGPLLVAADPGAGKTALLRNAAQAISLMADPRTVQFAVVAGRPEPWHDLVSVPQCIGVFPSYHNASSELLHSLVAWAHANKGGRQTIVLLVDDLTSIENTDPDMRQALAYLLLRGPTRRVWPLVALNAVDLGQVYPWLQAFRTRIFGRIENPRLAADLTGLPNVYLSGLRAGEQFVLREGKSWVKFRVP